MDVQFGELLEREQYMLIPRLRNNGKVKIWLNKLQLKIKKQIEDKIDSEVYTFEHNNTCVICGSVNSTLIGERDRYDLFYPVNICQSCGFVFVNPRLNQKSYNEFYNEEYRKLYLGSEKPNNHFFQEQSLQGKKIFNFLNDNNLLEDDAKYVFEIGCGAGGILHYFEEKGYETQGIDLGDEYIQFGKENYNLNLHSTNLKSFQPEHKPDIIIYSHVLEHLLNLEDELKLIKELSHPHTKLYIEVPSLKQMHKGYDFNILKYFHIAHTYHFTLTSLINLLQKNGFELVTGNEYVMSVFQLSSRGKQPIANDYEAVIRYISLYERLRWVYYLTPKAIKYYSGMVIIKLMDRLGVKEKVKAFLGKQKLL
jgi:2-polyprenyl-3-methyl-5-hydroxy-6-metoxy-1,4-benzoquinol methylase